MSLYFILLSSEVFVLKQTCMSACCTVLSRPQGGHIVLCNHHVQSDRCDRLKLYSLITSFAAGVPSVVALAVLL